MEPNRFESKIRTDSKPLHFTSLSSGESITCWCHRPKPDVSGGTLSYRKMPPVFTIPIRVPCRHRAAGSACKRCCAHLLEMQQSSGWPQFGRLWLTKETQHTLRSTIWWTRHRQSNCVKRCENGHAQLLGFPLVYPAYRTCEVPNRRETEPFGHTNNRFHAEGTASCAYGTQPKNGRATRDRRLIASTDTKGRSHSFRLQERTLPSVQACIPWRWLCHGHHLKRCKSGRLGCD
jgi:hypothetical protein